MTLSVPQWKTIATLLMACLLCGSFAFAQKKNKKNKKGDENSTSAPSKSKKDGIQAYSEVITEEAVSDSGLFVVHQIKDKWFFELKEDLIEKEILVVSRMSGSVEGLTFGGAGMKTRPQQVIRWQRHVDNLVLRSVSYQNVAS